MADLNLHDFTPVQLTVITTDCCTARCTHCVMNCLPEKKTKLSFEQIKHTVDEMEKIHPLSLVVFSGGEPTLLGDDLLEAIAYCSDRGILTRLVTNAFWATDETRAKAVLREWRECGLAELNISTDDYHAAYVPFENVKTAYFAAKNMGFSAVVLANSHAPDDTITPAYIEARLGEHIVRCRDEADGLQTDEDATGEDGTKYLLSSASLQRLGRGRSLPDSKFPVIENIDDLQIGCQWLMKTPALAPDGHIWSCCGIHCGGNALLDLGNPETESVAEILERASDHIILNALHILGPMFLRKLVKTAYPNIAFREQYGSVCEVCQEFTENAVAIAALRTLYPTLIRCMELAEHKDDSCQNESMSESERIDVSRNIGEQKEDCE